MPSHRRHSSPVRHHRMRRRAIVSAAAAALTAGAFSSFASTAAAQDVSLPADPVDAILTLAGEPGPHRVAGTYFTSPGVPAEAEAARPAVLVGPSTPLVIGDSLCTTTVAGYDAAGNAVAVTAGHCGTAGDEVRSGDDPDGTVIGTFDRAGTRDNGIILLNDSAQVTDRYNNAVITSLDSSYGADTAQVCKTGIATGTSCGPVTVRLGEDFAAQICASHGDSGAPVYAGERLIGILSGGLASLPACITPLQGPVHSPVFISTWSSVTAEMDAAGGVGAGFRLP
ncbi:S1 family peptidase [Corynebacterium terpenotabidum]|nr:S1 family peptidase [Corynebacterium terpenotabidum]